MGYQEFEFEGLQDYFSLAVDDPSDWPAVSAELQYRVHAPEPDVGIFDAQCEVTKVTYYLDGETFTDEMPFIRQLYDAISEEIEEGQDAVVEVIRNWINDCEAELEPDE